MIQVYQAKNPTFFDMGGTPNVIEDYAHVANVYAGDSLERAYQLTNSFETGWYENDHNVAFLGSPDHGMDGCRSTSVGDVLVRQEDGVFVTYVVASCGFRRVGGEVT